MGHVVLRVRADLTVDHDAPASRDVTDDLIARNRITTLGPVDHDVVDSGRIKANLPFLGSLDFDPVRAGHLLNGAAQLGDDALNRSQANADLRKNVDAILDALHRLGKLVQLVLTKKCFGIEPQETELLFEGFLASRRVRVLALLPEIGAKLVSRVSRPDELQPVQRRLGVGAGDDLDDVAVVELRAEGDHDAVDLAADKREAQLRVDAERKVDGG